MASRPAAVSTYRAWMRPYSAQVASISSLLASFWAAQVKVQVKVKAKVTVKDACLPYGRINSTKFHDFPYFRTQTLLQ